MTISLPAIASLVFAQAPASPVTHSWQSLGMALAATAAFGLLGIIILIIGFKIFDRLTPVSFDKEIAEKNIAAAIVMSAMILALSWIVVHSMN